MADSCGWEQKNVGSNTEVKQTDNSIAHTYPDGVERMKNIKMRETVMQSLTYSKYDTSRSHKNLSNFIIYIFQLSNASLTSGTYYTHISNVTNSIFQSSFRIQSGWMALTNAHPHIISMTKRNIGSNWSVFRYLYQKMRGVSFGYIFSFESKKWLVVQAFSLFFLIGSHGKQ